ncbi:hypothetical protein Pmar_PMAR024048 [Perkinsus marinus ATCC 50983]|uniref:Uncharacterized protein n=1 Tax=Perkinsus marinus (strain ATCC 50983 / TXsc) TaxID=423536 RepID=C5L6I3_PERM5|nr:hypothetical protein Pmar_PMAR024048 [Perkinsus marinus ATCC 50983]EER07644.1 hypothetical protein Pmar_PMAR024048 [Perkinsus marinus ATCC 50983]|eukprot:XP_002775828.1 hypothetical protein Pmar_PMAR024048 [Perkinsus marinus ATCC 50983]
MSSNAQRLPPDAIIQKRVKTDEGYAALERYTNGMRKAAMTASWFEGKSKNDFAENEKRNNDL